MQNSLASESLIREFGTFSVGLDVDDPLLLLDITTNINKNSGN